jgi:hypothetical protein
MIHRANADFWSDYRALPASIRTRAGQAIRLAEKQSAVPFLAIQKTRRPQRAGNLVGASDAENTAPWLSS